MSGRKKTASYRMRFFRCTLGVLTLHLLRGSASIAVDAFNYKKARRAGFAISRYQN